MEDRWIPALSFFISKSYRNFANDRFTVVFLLVAATSTLLAVVSFRLVDISAVCIIPPLLQLLYSFSFHFTPRVSLFSRITLGTSVPWSIPAFLVLLHNFSVFPSFPLGLSSPRNPREDYPLSPHFSSTTKEICGIDNLQLSILFPHLLYSSSFFYIELGE